jgi:hypothetical protein
MLTPAGRKAIQEELAESSPYCLEGHEETTGSSDIKAAAQPVVGS